MKYILFVLAGLIIANSSMVIAKPEQSTSPTAPASSAAQKLYATAQRDLLQLRVLLKNGDSQSSVGSGFFIGNSRLVITNFHVISQIALEPETYIGQFKDTQGGSGAIELLAVDVLHDLAVVRVTPQGSGFFKIPAAGEALATLYQGERLYSLGNPLDLGFTITEGTYNGISSRGFSDQLMFTGPVNPGMSGGPNITVDGQLAGVNVAHRRDGELVSFLVPARFVQELLARVTENMAPPEDFKPIIGEQLLQHQAIMVDKLMEKPFNLKKLGPYQLPVRESDQVRCWGDSNTDPKRYSTASIHCSMESEIFVSGDLRTGHITISHKYLHNKKLHPLQFSHLTSSEFSNQVYSTANSDNITPASCHEEFVRTNDLPLRALVCAEAYHQFAGLYDFTLVTATTDDSQKNLQSMINILGVSYENGTRLIRHFLESLARPPGPEEQSEPLIEKADEESDKETTETAPDTTSAAAEVTP